MADELTSAPFAPATPNEPGQSQASPTAAPQQSPVVEQGQQTPSAPSKVNLYELPEFKEYQRTISKTMTDLQRKLQEQEQRQHDAVMAQMSPEQKLAYQLRLKDQELTQYRQTLEQQQIAQQRAADIDRLATWSGAPANIFEAAETYDDAVRLAFEYARQNTPAAREAAQQRQEANRVDLGVGGALAPEERKKAEAKAALDRGDSRAYFKMLLED
jgi:hypothetical protein